MPHIALLLVRFSHIAARLAFGSCTGLAVITSACGCDVHGLCGSSVILAMYMQLTEEEYMERLDGVAAALRYIICVCPCRLQRCLSS